MADKPFSPACERNQGPIADGLDPWMRDRRRLLEIGSGTGQHAAFFAARWRHLQVQPSDHPEHLAGIQAWRDESALPNLLPPFALQAAVPPAEPLALPTATPAFDAVFSANTLHIMRWPQVQALFVGLPSLMAPGALLAIYGPFNDEGRFTSTSNAQFDAWLRARDPHSGLRDAGAVQALAHAQGLHLQQDSAMPSNNRLLVWRMERARRGPPAQPGHRPGAGMRHGAGHGWPAA